MEDVLKKPQLAILRMVDKRLGVGHGIYHGVRDMIFWFYVEHNPVAGSCKAMILLSMSWDITQDSQP